MCNLIASSIMICTGALGYAGPLDAVAERRYVAAWGGLDSNPAGYEVLLGLQDCALLGASGWLISGGRVYTALVADCQQRAHRLSQPMDGRGLLADVNRKGLSRQRGTLILRAENDAR